MGTRRVFLSVFDSFNVGFIFSIVLFSILTIFSMFFTYSVLKAAIGAAVISNSIAVCTAICLGFRRAASDSAVTGFYASQILLLFINSLFVIVHLYMPEPDFSDDD